ncbi:hypothetical protein D3C73_1458740 [compost metagenome]
MLAIGDVQRNCCAFSRWVDDFGNRFGGGCLESGLGFFQLGFTGLSDRTVDTTGQCRGLGHQDTSPAQGRSGGIDITLLQHDLAALQIGFGELSLVGLQRRIIG